MNQGQQNGHEKNSEGGATRYGVGSCIRPGCDVIESDSSHAWTFASGMMWGALIVMAADVLVGVR